MLKLVLTSVRISIKLDIFSYSTTPKIVKFRRGDRLFEFNTKNHAAQIRTKSPDTRRRGLHSKLTCLPRRDNLTDLIGFGVPISFRCQVNEVMSIFQFHYSCPKICFLL